MERLQRGRQRRSGPAEDGWFGQRAWRWWRKRHAAKKSRIAAMSRRRRIFRKIGVIATWLLGLLAVFVVAAVVLFYNLSDVPRPETLPLPQVATIEYADGSTMASIGTVNRTLVDLSKVPKPVQWDVLAAEDRGFYSEPGVSVTGTIRAAFNDLTGGDTQGGSGITQQYVKNAYLNNSRTLSRKLKELAIAVKLSRQYSKDQILEFYLNTVYFGRNSYGIQAGARAFFGVDVSKLTVAQGAVLAAGLRSPAYYDPSANPGAAKARWKYVLDGMVSTGHLTQAQADAQVYPKVLKPSDDSQLGVSGPKQLIVQRVLAELQAKGISQDEVYTRGLKIQTTIDPKAQKAAEAAISATFSKLTDQQKNMKNALIAVSPQTGGVLAYYGGPYGKNYAGANDYYDYASLGSASPGSSFKPYTLATGAHRDARRQVPGQPAHDQLDRGRQPVREDRGHAHLQRPQRCAVQQLAGQRRERDEVLAQHDLRPDGAAGRSGERREHRACHGCLEDDQRQADPGEREGRHDLRHRHRRLPGAPDRSGGRLRDARERWHHPAVVLRAEGDVQRR